jgi:lipid II:glycine glycyltransferase (peptidoglycan interpeptide bridge formation enzyme)
MSQTSIPFNSIFQQPWWLDAMAPSQWEEVTVERDNEVIARLPFVKKQKYGLTILSRPPLTQTLGPWIKTSEGKYLTQLADQKNLMTQLIEQLPTYDYFYCPFHHSIQNWLPFFWQGFSQTTAYTYVLENLEDPDMLWRDFRENIRREVRRAQKKVVIRTDLGIDKFLEVNALTYERQGIQFPYDPEVVRRLDYACEKHDSRRIFFAEDAEGKIHAAIYIVWDENSAYYLLGGGDPELRSSGATSWLMWEAIQFASKVTKKFDFEGSMIESIEQFFRAFGAKQTPYLRVTGMSRRMKFLMSGKEMLSTLNPNLGKS